MSILVTPSENRIGAPGRRVLTLPRGRELPLDGAVPLVMGVLNLTPDSFSDGGLWTQPERAIEHALGMFDGGAHIVDLGAESTRPGGGVYGDGALEVSPSEESDRLLPVVEALRQATNAPISVDTRKAVVARQALAAGADLVNDVSALGDPEMAPLIAELGCPAVLMHSRGSLASMQRNIHFDDVVGEVSAELRKSKDAAVEAGIEAGQIVIDPGIGFGKTAAQNLQILRRLGELDEIAPVLVGASRKSFIGDITGTPATARLPGSLAAVAWAVLGTAAIVRVHDVSETAQFLDIWAAISSTEGGVA